MNGRFRNIMFFCILAFSTFGSGCSLRLPISKAGANAIEPLSVVICHCYKGVTVIDGDQAQGESYLWLSDKMITENDKIVRWLQLLQDAEPASYDELGLGGINGELLFFDESRNPVCYVIMYATSRVIAIYSPVLKRRGEYYFVYEESKRRLVRSPEFDKEVMPFVSGNYRQAVHESLNKWGGYIIERRRGRITARGQNGRESLRKPLEDTPAAQENKPSQ